MQVLSLVAPYPPAQERGAKVTTYGEAIKALLRAGFSHREIIDLTQSDGREAVLQLGEDALKDEAKK